MVFYTGPGTDGGWILVRFDNDFMGRHTAACRVRHSVVSGVRSGEMSWQCQAAERWAKSLRSEGFVEAARLPVSSTDADPG